MTIKIELPADLDLALLKDLEREAREAIAVRLYREQKLSHGELAKYLGIARGEVDEILRHHEPFDEFTMEEISIQARGLAALRQRGCS